METTSDGADFRLHHKDIKADQGRSRSGRSTRPEPDPEDVAAVLAAAARRDSLLRSARADLEQVLTSVETDPAARHRRESDAARLHARVAGLVAARDSVAFGRLDLVDGERHYLGRTAVADADGSVLVLDWRAPAARPFYAATAHRPLGVARRRHLRVRRDRVLGHDDEVLVGGDGDDPGSMVPARHLLDALTAPRTGRMRDVVRTVQADQDAMIRADPRGALVVQGAPGAGKTVVALHRVAYLLHEHRDRLSRTGVLLVGPSRTFLDYVSDVLPALGETAVVPATVGDLFPGVAATYAEPPAAAEVKGRLVMVDVLRRAVAVLQAVPPGGAEVAMSGTPVVLDEAVLAAARERARAGGLPHERARATYAEAVVDALTARWGDRIGTDPWDGSTWLDEADLAALRSEVAESEEVAALVEDTWPRLTPERLLGRLWSEPDLLAAATEGILGPAERDLLARDEPGAWTPADLPLLDEAAELLGHDDTEERAAEVRRRAQEEQYARGVLEVLHGSRPLEDDDEADTIDWEDPAAVPPVDSALLAARFATDDHRSLAERALADRTWVFDHVVVDEAQELTPMQWRLLVRRCPSRSMTVVGDLAQASRVGAARTWAEALEPALAGRWRLAELDVSYRTPAELLEPARLVLARHRPDLRPPRALRRGGRPVRVLLGVTDVAAAVADVVGDVLAGRGGTGGTVAVVAAEASDVGALPPGVARCTPGESKGLEFDAVVVVEPQLMAATDLYVALTRATDELVVVTGAATVPWADEPATSCAPGRTRPVS